MLRRYATAEFVSAYPLVTARKAAGRFVPGNDGRSTLKGLKGALTNIVDRRALDKSIRQKVKSIVALYSLIQKRGDVFIYGNHSLWMHFVNMLLRLNGLEGVSHGNEDLKVIDRLGFRCWLRAFDTLKGHGRISACGD
jgi:hypothetical protein